MGTVGTPWEHLGLPQFPQSDRDSHDHQERRGQAQSPPELTYTTTHPQPTGKPGQTATLPRRALALQGGDRHDNQDCPTPRAAPTLDLTPEAPMTITRPKRDIPAAVRADVLAATACHYCGDILLPREVEHHVPLSRGGTNDPDNLVAACVACNTQKRALLVSEWRAYRATHGMPWPPLASHPTEPVHYGDRCRGCVDRHYATRAGDLPDHWYMVTPNAMHPSPRGDGYRCYYRCPAGHTWTCYYAADRGYFSDCPCLYCWNLREDAGVKHWPALPRFGQG